MAVNFKLRDLECPICRSLLRDPFVTTCGHTFCHTCLSQHQSVKSTCPTCSTYLTRDHVYPNHLLGQVSFSTTQRCCDQGCRCPISAVLWVLV